MDNLKIDKYVRKFIFFFVTGTALNTRTLVNGVHAGGVGPRTRAQTLTFSLLSLFSTGNRRYRVKRRRGAEFARKDPRLVTRADRTGCGGPSVLRWLLYPKFCDLG